MSKQAYVKAYPKEFREKVVQLVQRSERSVSEVAKEFAISTDSVQRWVQQTERDQGARKEGLSSQERAELVQLGRELKQARMELEILGKGKGLVRLGDRFDAPRVFEFIRANQAQYPIACMCRVLGVSTSGYYAWCQRPPSRRALEAEKLSQQIAEVHAKSRQTYGVLRVRAALQAQGTCISRRRVARLMRAQGLAGTSRRTTRRDP